MGVPLSKVTLNALGEQTWHTLRQRKTADWQMLPGVGQEKARQIQRWIQEPHIEALAKWLAAQRINGYGN